MTPCRARFSFTAWSVALGCLWLASPLLAHAAPEKPGLVVVPFVGPGGDADRQTRGATAEAVAALKRREGSFRLVPPPPLRAEGPLSSVKKAPVDPALLFNDGRRALGELRFDDAAQAFRKGVEVSLHEPATADYPAVFEGLLGMAAAYFRLDDEKSAQAALGTLVRLQPELKLASDKYPPVFSRELEKARKRLEKGGSASVVIEGPSGATAFLDGRDLGLVPATENNLPLGTHYVKVEGTQGERFGQAVELKAEGAKVRATFASAGAADPQVAMRLDADAAARLSAYTEAAGADYALLAVVSPQGGGRALSPALFSKAQRGFLPLSPVMEAQVEALADEVSRKVKAFGTPAALPLALSTRLPGGTPAAAPPTVAGKPAEPPTPRVVLQPEAPAAAAAPVAQAEAVETSRQLPTWVWIAAGVGAAALGGGVYYGVTQANRPATGTVTATW